MKKLLFFNLTTRATSENYTKNLNYVKLFLYEKKKRIFVRCKRCKMQVCAMCSMRYVSQEIRPLGHYTYIIYWCSCTLNIRVTNSSQLMFPSPSMSASRTSSLEKWNNLCQHIRENVCTQFGIPLFPFLIADHQWTAEQNSFLFGIKNINLYYSSLTATKKNRQCRRVHCV